MSTNNFLFYATQILAGLARDLLLFPVWWYTRGIMETADRIAGFWAHSLKSLNLAVWLKNIFVPMYGQRDFTGVLISVLMRIVQIILRSLGFVFLLVAGVVAILLWIVAPVIVAWQIIYQIV
jgi:hypothetical protein